jgi:hypothetical protein
MAHLRQAWSKSKSYRIALIAALVYVLLRLAIQIIFLVVLWFMPPAGVEPAIPDDLRIYLDAASHFRLREDLYIKGTVERMEFYQYAPSYALAFVPFLWLPSYFTSAIFHTLLHILAYGLLYIWWARIFRRLGLNRAGEVLTWTLPLWLLFSEFWSDLGFLNIYIFLALLATLLIDAVLNEHLGWSLLWLSIILQAKPQWAFAVVVPLLLGRYRFFFKLVALAAVTYAAITGLTILAAGPSYGWQQYVDYSRLLRSIQTGNYPWRGPDMPFLGYNHSITQIVVYLFGVTPTTLRLATGIKALLLLPLAAVSLRHILWPARLAGRDTPQLGLDWAFALYLGAFIWLDMVWELALSIAVFTYLLATSRRQGARIIVWGVFLPYALLDLWRIATVAIFGFNVVLPGFYILTDPTIYIPLVMIIILVFYALLVSRLWTAPTVRLRASNTDGS